MAYSTKEIEEKLKEKEQQEAIEKGKQREKEKTQGILESDKVIA